MISTKINNLDNIIINTTNLKLIMECQSETPIHTVNKYPPHPKKTHKMGHIWG